MHVKSREEWASEREALLEGLREFAALMKRAPFRNVGGLRGVSAFALWWFVRRSEPEVVFESGVWKGFSTWLIEQAAPKAELFCFDPVVFLRDYLRWSARRGGYRSPRAHYSGMDFSCAAIPDFMAGREKVLAFFDDHQNKWPRLRQCRAYGIREIVFDDNYAGVSTHRSLEDEPRALLETEIAEYEIFPPLWTIEARISPLQTHYEGLGFPVERALKPIYDERQWHSSVTWLRLTQGRLPR